MTLSQRLKKIKEDWVVIVISLLAAIFLYVFYQISDLDTTTFSVPLKIEANGNLLLEKEVPSRIKLTVKGKPEDIGRLSENDFSAYLNLDYYTVAGNYSVPVSLTLSNNASNISTLEIRPNPQNIDVVLDEKIIEYVPIFVRTTGNPIPGYEVAAKEAEPQLARIVGPSSAIKSVKNIETELWNITEASESMEKTLKLVNTNKRIYIDEPTSVNAKIIISEIIEDKTFEDTSITILNPTEGLEVKTEITKANVTVNGTQNYLKDYKLPQGMLYVDCSWITEPGEYELEVHNYKLSNLNLISVEPSTISVTISEKKQEEVSEENVDLGEDITSENSQTEEAENVSSENQLSETTNQEISEWYLEQELIL